jgi:hypothetical protein
VRSARESRGEARRGRATGVEAERLLRCDAMSSDASMRFCANDGERRERGDLPWRALRRDETRRGEVRQRGEGARALKAIRTPHKPNHRSMGSRSLEEGNWWQDRAAALACPCVSLRSAVLCGCSPHAEGSRRGSGSQTCQRQQQRQQGRR